MACKGSEVRTAFALRSANIHAKHSRNTGWLPNIECRGQGLGGGGAARGLKPCKAFLNTWQSLVAQSKSGVRLVREGPQHRLPEGGREGVSGKLRPTRCGVECCACPACLPSVGQSVARGTKAGVAVVQPRSQVRPAPHPVAAISLSVALWRDSAVVPTGNTRPAGSGVAGRVTSL